MLKYGKLNIIYILSLNKLAHTITSNKFIKIYIYSNLTNELANCGFLNGAIIINAKK